MNAPFDVEEFSGTVEKLVNTQLREFAQLAEARGMSFAASAVLSACAEVAGAALATARDEEMRDQGGLAMVLAIKKAMDRNGAEFEAHELLERLTGRTK